MLPKWYPHRYDDQDGDFVARHVAAIAAHAQVAVLFATVARGPQSAWLRCEADLAGPVPVLRYYYRARFTGVSLLDKLLKLLLYFVALCRGYRLLCARWGARPDLVHVHVLLRTGLWAWWLRLAQGTPYLITEHWTRYLPEHAHGVGGLRRHLTRLVVGQAAALHTVSDNLRQALGWLGIRNPRTVVIPNVVDTELFRPATLAKEAAYSQGSGYLLHVAAFNEQAKNLSGLLRVVARLLPERPQLRLRVAGYGPAEATLRALADSLGLLRTGAVTFLGKLPPAQVAAEMREAAALVLFSNYENLPCVLLEAQASGLPAVATAVGGVPELLPPDGPYGLLVPPRDEAALAQALRTVLDQPHRFDRAALRAQAVRRYGVGAVGQQFADLYAQVLSA